MREVGWIDDIYGRWTVLWLEKERETGDLSCNILPVLYERLVNSFFLLMIYLRSLRPGQAEISKFSSEMIAGLYGIV